MKIIIDNNIIENLEYFHNIFTNIKTLSFLYNLFKKGYIEINENENENEIDNNILNLKEIKTSDRADNSILLIFKSKDEKINKQYWKIGKFLKLIFKIYLNITDINDKDLYMLVGIISGYNGFENYIKEENLIIEISDKFTQYYDVSNYASNKGSLGHSCMNNKLDSVIFYNLLSPSVSIVTLNKNNKIYGRCLLWNTSKGYYLDRLYLVNDLYYYGFYIYMYKKYNIKYNYLHYSSGKINISNFFVKVKKENIKNFVNENLHKPFYEILDVYLDTMGKIVESKDHILIYPLTENDYFNLELIVLTMLNMDNLNIDNKGILSDHMNIIKKYIKDKSVLTLYNTLSEIFYIYEDSKKEICFLSCYFENHNTSFITILTNNEKNKFLSFVLSDKYYKSLMDLIKLFIKEKTDNLDNDIKITNYKIRDFRKFQKRIDNKIIKNFYKLDKSIIEKFENKETNSIFDYFFFYYDQDYDEYYIIIFPQYN